MTILHTQDGLPVGSGNRLPVELYGPDGAALFAARRLAADNLALPTAPDVLATLLGYDGANLGLLRLDAGRNLLVGWRTAAGEENERTAAGGLSSAAIADTVPAGAARHRFQALPALYSGSQWEPQRANVEGTLLASAARTATTSTANQTNHNGRALLAFLRCAISPGGGETLALVVRAVDPTSGETFALVSSP